MNQDMNEERKKILEMVEKGQISAEQGATLLGLVPPTDEPVQEGPDAEGEPVAQDLPLPEGRPAAHSLWVAPLIGGMSVLLTGAVVVMAMYGQHRVNAWTWLCGWIPLFLGTAVVTIAVWARDAHWIHVRVRGRRENVSISLPVPLRLTALAIGVARRFVPKFRDTGVDEVILALHDGLESGQEIAIEVEDDEEGEHVEVRID